MMFAVVLSPVEMDKLVIVSVRSVVGSGFVGVIFDVVLFPSVQMNKIVIVCFAMKTSKSSIPAHRDYIY